MKVGQSHRTKGKHDLTARLLGREAGVIGNFAQGKTKPPAGMDPTRCLFIDACAGNGAPSHYSGTSSPSIVIKQVEYLRARGVDARAILVEQDGVTYAELERNVAGHEGVTAFHGKAQDGLYLPDDWSPRCPAFVIQDPNKITDWSFGERLLEWYATLEFACSFHTQGCNVNGLKRLPYEGGRSKWFEMMKAAVGAMPRHHDALIVRLVGDDASWGYLATVPAVDRWRGPTAGMVHKAFGSADDVPSLFPTQVEMAWLRRDPEKFNEIVRKLYLRKKELQAL